MTSRRTYAVQHQRLVVGQGYTECEPHRACRAVIIETTSVPGKHGRKPYHIKRNYEIFTGPAMTYRARLTLDGLTSKTKGKPKEQKAYLYRSLTIVEYDRATSHHRDEGSY